VLWGKGSRSSHMPESKMPRTCSSIHMAVRASQPEEGGRKGGREAGREGGREGAREGE